ncbi:TPA: helix-turn-helix domain-containing protein [Stenotrophomonas maltophilia]
MIPGHSLSYRNRSFGRAFLAFSRLLAPIIDALQADPGSGQSLVQWAEVAGVSSRTPARRWVAATGLGCCEWRQRLKLAASLPLLQSDCKVGDVAKRVGYSGPSPFIAMFRRLTGMCPTQLKSAV